MYISLNITYRLLIFILLVSSLEAWSKPKAGLIYNKFTETCMGTDFTLLIDHPNKIFAKKAASMAFKEAHRLDQIFSDYISDSELSRLSINSGSSEFYPLSEDLFRVLAASQKLAIETKGAFDITIGPFSRLWRIARFRKTLPNSKVLLNTHKRVGHEKLILNYEKKEAQLLENAMVLDLGGIAKGYAADQMLKILKEFGVSRVLIDAGGDILLGDAPDDRSGWQIEIGGRIHPDLPILTVSNIAIATSGDFEQSVTLNDQKFSHLINPFTGIGLTNLSQVTVLAPSAMVADSLASACLVLGSKKGMKYLESKQQIQAFFLEKKESRIELYRYN